MAIILISLPFLIDNCFLFLSFFFTFSVFDCKGQLASTIQATDRDDGENGRVSYSVVSGAVDGYFKLDSNTGELTIEKSLDLETARISNWTFTLLVEAKDHGIPQRSSNATFMIKVNSVNEYSPQFTITGIVLLIPENTVVGTLLYRVTATDNDFGSDGLIM